MRLNCGCLSQPLPGDNLPLSKESAMSSIGAALSAALSPLGAEASRRNGVRAFDTLLRYRGTALAELWRALRLLKALEAEAAASRHEASNGGLVPEPETHADPLNSSSTRSADRTEPSRNQSNPKAAKILAKRFGCQPRTSRRLQTGAAPTPMTLPAGQSRGLIPGTAPGRQRRAKNRSNPKPARILANRACSGVVEPAPRDAADPGWRGRADTAGKLPVAAVPLQHLDLVAVRVLDEEEPRH
jgi:hypothetical protein